MVRVLHTADWQIGMKAAHVGAVGELVRAARLRSARRVVELARQHDADLIVVTGDTFEDNAVDRMLVQAVADILGSFHGPVYITPGNHDPCVPGSVWEHAAWSSHPRLFVLTSQESIELDSCTLLPCPLHEKHSLKDPTRWIDVQSSSKIAIGLAHGSVQGVAQDEPDYPIARDAASRTGLDYLALGHWHSAALYQTDDGATRMAYAGTHEATKFGEPRSGNALLVEIAERGAPPDVTIHRTGELHWKSLHRDVQQPTDLSRLREEIETLDNADATLLDIRVDGFLGKNDQPEIERIDELIRARFLYGRFDYSRLMPRPDDDAWLQSLPVGVLRDVAERLKALSDPAGVTDRPDYASPEIATQALLELFRIAAEADG